MVTKADLTELRHRMKRLGCSLRPDPDGVRYRLVRGDGQAGPTVGLDTEGLKRLKSQMSRLERQYAEAYWDKQAENLLKRYGYVSDDGGETYRPKGSV
jgi:hypothetical protein